MKRDWCALIFAMVFPTFMAWLYFVVLAGDKEGPGSAPGKDMKGAVLVAYLAGKVIQFSFPVVFVWLVDPASLRPSKPTGRGLALGAIFGLAVGAGLLVLYHVRLHEELVKFKVPEKVAAKVAHFGLNYPAGFLSLGVFISLIHSLAEEYYWRWFVFGWLRKHVALPAAMVVSSLAFMSHHVIVLAVYIQGPMQFFTLVVPFALCVAAGGMVWAWMYQRTDSIYPSWISHLLIDAAIMVVGYDLLFGP